MKTEPIVPADILFDDGVPFAPAFGDVYHPRAGALGQAEHVFLRGNALPSRWQGRPRFVVLETGFGLGNNFLATWEAWRHDPRRCEALHFISIEKHPPRREALQQAHAHSPLHALAAQLMESWPPPTPNLHLLPFEGGRVRLLLALGDVAHWLPELLAEVDAFYLDGFAPAKNPAMWEPRLMKAIARLAAPGATAATWSVARAVREGLSDAGFEVRGAPGYQGKAQMSVARFAPRVIPPRPPGRRSAVCGRSEALVIGAGLAGAAITQALAGHGWTCTVIDRQPEPAAETSGNPAGLFHGIVTAEDGAHARFHRSAALRAQQHHRQAVAQGVPGRVDGLLRLAPEQDRAALQALVDRQGLPHEFVQAVDSGQASALAGVTLSAPAWFYPGGGWLAPAAWSRWALSAAARCLWHARVDRLEPVGERWRAISGDGQVLAEADVAVLANAHDALRLLGQPAWPVGRARGQVSLVQSDWQPALPIAGTGYAIGLGDGRLLCGATSQPGYLHEGVRDSDTDHNLAQLQRLSGRVFTPEQLITSRVGWRMLTDDRLPLLGPVPVLGATGPRLEQPRQVPRQPGLYTLCALGSRGITWAPLAAEVLAAWISGAPVPLETGLLDSVDAARFVSRAVRRAAR